MLGQTRPPASCQGYTPETRRDAAAARPSRVRLAPPKRAPPVHPSVGRAGLQSSGALPGVFPAGRLPANVCLAPRDTGPRPLEGPPSRSRRVLRTRARARALCGHAPRPVCACTQTRRAPRRTVDRDCARRTCVPSAASGVCSPLRRAAGAPHSAFPFPTHTQARTGGPASPNAVSPLLLLASSLSEHTVRTCNPRMPQMPQKPVSQPHPHPRPLAKCRGGSASLGNVGHGRARSPGTARERWSAWPARLGSRAARCGERLRAEGRFA